MFFIIIWLLFGLLCAVIAANKNKSVGAAVLSGIIFGPFALIYYIFASSEEEEEDTEPKSIRNHDLRKCDCGAPISNDDQYCQECGEKVKPTTKECPNCSTINRISAKFCSECRFDFYAKPKKTKSTTPKKNLPKEKENKSLLIFGLIIGIIVLITLIIALVSNLNKNTYTTTPVEQGNSINTPKTTTQSYSNPTTDTKERKVTFGADKYSDGYVAFMVGVFDKQGNCDWVNGDLTVTVMNQEGKVLTEKVYKNLKKADYTCINEDDSSEIYIGTLITQAYMVKFNYIINGKSYSGTEYV